MLLEVMGEAFCMSVRCMFTPPTHKGPLLPNDRYNAEVSPSILPGVHSCDLALLGHSARTLGCNGPTGVDISMTGLARRSPEAGPFFGWAAIMSLPSPRRSRSPVLSCLFFPEPKKSMSSVSQLLLPVSLFSHTASDKVLSHHVFLKRQDGMKATAKWRARRQT